MHILRLDHATINTDRLDETIDFYGRLMGLTPGFRPDFGFPGAWLYPQGGDYALVHLIEQPVPDRTDVKFNHIAFRGADIIAFLDKMRAESLPYKVAEVPDTTFTQIHFHDPNGVKVEMLFDELVDPSLLT